jgi:DNA-binding ferritin-like protein
MKKGKAKGTVEKPITQEYKEVSIDVAEELENFAQDQSNIQSIQETFGEMTDEEADDAFVEAVKQCKTK